MPCGIIQIMVDKTADFAYSVLKAGAIPTVKYRPDK
jgi:hypothetical protein